MKYPSHKLRINKLSLKIILMVEVVLILSNSIFCVVSIINSRASVRKSIQQRMLDIANCASGSVNGDSLEKLTAEDANSEEYREVYNSLAVFRDNVELEYVYGIKDEGDGRFTFTVDPAIDDPAIFGDEVEYTEALAAAARGKASVDETPYTDAWGSSTAPTVRSLTPPARWRASSASISPSRGLKTSSRSTFGPLSSPITYSGVIAALSRKNSRTVTEF